MSVASPSLNISCSLHLRSCDIYIYKVLLLKNIWTIILLYNYYIYSRRTGGTRDLWNMNVMFLLAIGLLRRHTYLPCLYVYLFKSIIILSNINVNDSCRNFLQQVKLIGRSLSRGHILLIPRVLHIMLMRRSDISFMTYMFNSEFKPDIHFC